MLRFHLSGHNCRLDGNTVNNPVFQTAGSGEGLMAVCFGINYRILQSTNLVPLWKGLVECSFYAYFCNAHYSLKNGEWRAPLLASFYAIFS